MASKKRRPVVAVSSAKKESKGPSEDDQIVQEAKDRFKRCEDWEATFRSRYLEDIKFANADPDNGWQWPDDIRKARDTDKRPCLTVNRVRQYNLDIINDSKQNKVSIKCIPSGDKATYKGAQVMKSVISHIQYRSRAQQAYDSANVTQVQGGVGYWRVRTDYVDAESFDQELLIERIVNPLMVFLDPDAQQADKSDSNFGFVYADIPQETFDKDYPEYADKVGMQSIGQLSDWIGDEHVRVCEYWRRRKVAFKIIAFTNPEDPSQAKVMRTDDIPKDILKELLDDSKTKQRDGIEYKVEWFKIAGDMVIERGDWAGTTIPIIQVVGEETIVEGQMDRKGHTRGLKDPQRIYNYWTSCGVEFGALQSKIPFIAPARAIEGLEVYWANLNTQNASILPYNDIDDEGQAIAAPQRQQPPTMAPAYIQGMQIASEELRMASGQFQSDMGEPDNATSGVAINQRQRAGDNATYHFIDNLAIGIEYTGRILIEMIPKIYDTRRVLMIIGEDGTMSEIVLDPAAAQEFQEEQMKAEDKVKIIFNPSFAKYSVQADIGPAYATRRQEAFAAFSQILAQNPALTTVCGDLMFRAADFPMADELAERLKRMVPDNLLGKGPTPEVQQLTQTNQQLMAHIQSLMESYQQLRNEKGAENSIKIYGEQINEYNAETKRMAELLKGFDPEQIATFTAKLVLDTLQNNPEKPQLPKEVDTSATPVQGATGGNESAPAV